MKTQKHRKKRRYKKKKKQHTKQIYGKGFGKNIFGAIGKFFSKTRDRRWR